MSLEAKPAVKAHRAPKRGIIPAVIRGRHAHQKSENPRDKRMAAASINKRATSGSWESPTAPSESPPDGTGLPVSVVEWLNK